LTSFTYCHTKIYQKDSDLTTVKLRHFYDIFGLDGISFTAENSEIKIDNKKASIQSKIFFY